LRKAKARTTQGSLGIAQGSDFRHMVHVDRRPHDQILVVVANARANVSVLYIVAYSHKQICETTTVPFQRSESE